MSYWISERATKEDNKGGFGCVIMEKYEIHLVIVDDTPNRNPYLFENVIASNEIVMTIMDSNTYQNYTEEIYNELPEHVKCKTRIDKEKYLIIYDFLEVALIIDWMYKNK